MNEATLLRAPIPITLSVIVIGVLGCFMLLGLSYRVEFHP